MTEEQIKTKLQDKKEAQILAAKRAKEYKKKLKKEAALLKKEAKKEYRQTQKLNRQKKK